MADCPTLSANAKPQVIDLLGVFCISSLMLWGIPTKDPTTTEVIGLSMGSAFTKRMRGQ
jgi:hypothetical protein